MSRLFSQQLDEDVSECWSALLMLTDKLIKSPDNSQRLLQVRAATLNYQLHTKLHHSIRPSFTSVLVFQEVFDQRFDSALQSLISDFLSRIEQLFPVPDFKQVISKTLNSQSSNSAVFHFHLCGHSSISGCLLVRCCPLWAGGLSAEGGQG